MQRKIKNNFIVLIMGPSENKYHLDDIVVINQDLPGVVNKGEVFSVKAIFALGGGDFNYGLEKNGEALYCSIHQRYLSLKSDVDLRAKLQEQEKAALLEAFRARRIFYTPEQQYRMIVEWSYSQDGRFPDKNAYRNAFMRFLRDVLGVKDLITEVIVSKE